MFTPKYIHIRHYDDRGYPKPCGGATVAYLPANEERTLYYASVARCRSDERYVKREGRVIATDRIYNSMRYLVAVNPKHGTDTVQDQIMDELVDAGVFKFWRQ